MTLCGFFLNLSLFHSLSPLSKYPSQVFQISLPHLTFVIIYSMTLPPLFFSLVPSLLSPSLFFLSLKNSNSRLCTLSPTPTLLFFFFSVSHSLSLPLYSLTLNLPHIFHTHYTSLYFDFFLLVVPLSI